MRYRKTRKTIAAAVRIDQDLYRFAMERVTTDDSNFSRYVRNLIRRDLNSASEQKVSVAK